jgi:hypothetical protein
MRNRMTLAASSVVVLVVAASSLGVQPGSAQTAKAQAKADECQSRPGASTPRGSHWYYRIERPSGRRCWYLGAAKQKVQAAPAEQTERAAPVERRAASVPVPRPNARRADEEAEIPANATAANAADANASPATATTNADPAAANQFSAGWPAVPNVSVSNDRDVTAAVADDAVTADEQPADMPMVWPALAANEDTTVAQAGETAPGLGHLLIFLTAMVAFVAIAVRAILKLLSSSRGRSRPMAPVARAAAPVIRARAPGAPAAPESLVQQAKEEATAPAIERLREVAKRWDTPARVPRQPRIPAYEVMSDYEEQPSPPVRRRAVA